MREKEINEVQYTREGVLAPGALIKVLLPVISVAHHHRERGGKQLIFELFNILWVPQLVPSRWSKFCYTSLCYVA
jgi:hypothetical protein